MGPKGLLISPVWRTFMPEFLALAISTGVLFQFGFPLDDTIRNYPQLLMAAALTFFLGMILLTLRLAMTATKPLINPTSTCWIDRLALATLTASFATLILALPEAFTAFTNSFMLFPWSVLGELGLILVVIAVAVAYKLFIKIPASCFEQYIKVVCFTFCVAVAGLYTESIMDSTINFSSVVYQTFNIHQFVMVPCTFVLGLLLLILGVVVPDSSAVPFVSVMFKEVFARLVLSVGCITLLIGAFLTICALIFSPTMAGGVGDGIKVGAM